MSREEVEKGKPSPHVWVPRVVLTFLVFLTLAFVAYEVTVGLGGQDLSSNRLWALIVTLTLLLLLPVVDRLLELRISPGGVEAKLSEAKAHALETVDALEDREIAQAARAQILQAKDPVQVQAAMEMAMELNVVRVVERLKEAIRQKRKCYVRYRPEPSGAIETYLVAPLDIKPGKTPATRSNDYLWAHSYEHGRVISLRLGRVVGVELSEETFDPAEVMADWRQKQPEWNVPRSW